MDPLRDRYEFTPSSPVRHIKLGGCFVQCTKCRALVPISDVGLRVMADGDLRNHARCVPCRGG